MHAADRTKGRIYLSLLIMQLGVGAFGCAKPPRSESAVTKKNPGNVKPLNPGPGPDPTPGQQRPIDSIGMPTKPTGMSQESSPTPAPVVQTPVTPAPEKPNSDPVIPQKPNPVAVISSEGDGRFEISDFRKADPRTQGRGGIKGKIQTFSMAAKDSKIFPRVYNDNTNKNQKDNRRIQVYLPPGFEKGKEYPFMIGMDADWWTDPLMTTMDNLIQDKKIPAMIGIFADNGGGDSRGNQRGLEYDTVGPENAKYFAQEVLPEIEKRYGVKFTTNGEGGGLFGGSSSGAAAFTAAWFMPERFRKVLGYSTTFTSQGGGQDKQYKEGAWEYQKHIIRESEVKPLRVSLEVSSKDNTAFNSTTEANEKTYAALKEKGYHVRLQVMINAKHVDGSAMNSTMADNMIWLWRDYPK